MKLRSYSRQRKLKNDEKLGPQAQAIFDALPDSGKIPREDLIAALEKVITTKQPVERVFGFYRKTLLGMGVMNEHVEVVEKEGEASSEKKAPRKSAKGAKGSAKKAA